MFYNFEIDFPKTFVRIDKENEKVIKRKQTFYERIKSFLDYVKDGFEEANAVIFYLSDGNTLTIQFEELCKISIGEDFFSFEFKKKEIRTIVISYDTILYYEIVLDG